MSEKVNVVLHGSLAFIEEQSYISVLVPDLGVEHEYLAGIFENEVSFNSGTYVLDGVVNAKSVAGGPRADLDDLGGVTVSGCSRPDIFEKLYAEILLPWPESIWTARGTQMQASEFNGVPPGVPGASWLFAPVSILTYSVIDGARPGLIGHTVRLEPDQNGSFPRFHIFAQGSDDLTNLQCKSHVQNEFAAVAGFFPQLSGMSFVGPGLQAGTATRGTPPTSSFPDVENSKELQELSERKPGVNPPCTCGCKTCCRLTPAS